MQTSTSRRHTYTIAFATRRRRLPAQRLEQTYAAGSVMSLSLPWLKSPQQVSATLCRKGHLCLICE
ncbi:hypothetical protein OH77DRAFT_1418122 [Trametes cingulata]|nr:hypothetical protein OH77DRAFT_1418122 [Trametes cingulata]